jgi:hypothetical protein
MRKLRRASSIQVGSENVLMQKKRRLQLAEQTDPNFRFSGLGVDAARRCDEEGLALN